MPHRAVFSSSASIYPLGRRHIRTRSALGKVHSCRTAALRTKCTSGTRLQPGLATRHLSGPEKRPSATCMPVCKQPEYFKRPWIIKPFIERVQACQAVLPVELLVNVDHPADHEAWAWSSYNTSGLVVPVFSNNVHEIRAYNRLAHMARGDILVLMADDDLPPKDCSWLRGVVDLLDKWPDVGVVGVRNYQHCWNIGGHYNKGDWFKDPATGIKAHWVQRVDMAPMIVRRSAYLYIGGMDETLSEPGMCGIVSDWDICHRMWTAGWSVMAASPLLMQGDGHESGTHKPQTAHKCWSLQQGTAGAVMSLRQDVSWELEMCEAARTLNLKHLVLVEQSQCPYEKLGCDLQQQASAHQQQG
eukprot:CAMPEP_0202922730 /NCGR_PEP_ID=MMETSP1392-20130828/78076_1 /ASSEMBLY_ACC=CAM_ASM_000868 /TAXON_ID=225041 /ORGANISM="Chlamydomonas chlamydogama, Strain SAG 11-48b" /LENGTH=357 /DNA_ID=CAMNT_0049616373 /DNA_START=208 /DNA_END=1281 /DNA_ORIENTATION=+